MTIRRRDFVSMMAAASVALKSDNFFRDTNNDCPPKPTSGDFFLWVHGIFGITYQEQSMILASPNLNTSSNRHVYKIGRVTDYSCGIYSGVTDIPEQYYYLKIQGYNSPGLPVLDPNEVMLTKASLTPYTKGKYYFELPFPQAILPLRFLKTDICPQTDPGVPQGGVAPFAHVMKFKGVAASQVQMVWNDPNGKAQVFLKAKDNHLHLFAEEDPDCDESAKPCHNRGSALNSLLACYETDSTFVMTGDPKCAPPLDNILDVSPDLREQLFLAEWAGKCRAAFTTQPSSASQPTIAGHQCPHLLVADGDVYEKLQQNSFTKHK